jgi:hypothetical protein
MQIYELATVIKGVKVIFYEIFSNKKAFVNQNKGFLQ